MAMVTSDSKDLIRQVIRATWSLEEAAHLVHGVNPAKHPVDLSDETSTDPVCRTYFWLKKENGRERLYRVGGDEENPRFSPGTLMRHLSKNRHYVSREVLRIYDTAHGQRGDKALMAEAREIYRTAAALIWKDDPALPAARVAELLSNLPNEFTKNWLAPVTIGTIRKWLRGRGPGRVGRPPSRGKEVAEPDLGKIAEELDGN